MPSVAVGEPQLIPSIAGVHHRPPPRSAGASSRPMRSENISELVRFFQTPQGNGESAAEEHGMNIIRHDGAMDLFKAGQRRLRQLGQAKPDKRIRGTESPVPSEKSSSIRSTTDKDKAKRQHLQALQREGLIPNADDSHNSLDTSRSRSMQDVEAMGRPWLDDSMPAKDGRKSNSDSSSHLRRESLGLGDLAALVEFSVSFPEYYSDEPNPPPYQAQNPNPPGPSERSSNANAQPATASTNNDHNDRLSDNLPRPHTHRDASALAEPRAALDHVAPAAAPSRASATSKTVDNQPNRGQDDNGCSGDDAKSLAVLLRATERLGREKKVSRAPVHATAGPSNTSGLQPHSLNQGVTDTPLFVKAPEVQVKHGRAEEAARNKTASRGNGHLHPPALEFPPQSEPDGLVLKNHNVGPIPLKLVAECLPPRGSSRTAISKSASPQLLLSSSISNKKKSDSVLLQPTHTASNAPRPQILLSPFPIQTRRARSLTPDVASGGKQRKKKKQKLSPLYVVNAASPLPPPDRPLPSVPQQQGADVNDQNPLADRKPSTTMPTPAPDMSKGQDADSPTLGPTVHKPKLRRSLIGPRPSSRYSIRSNDQSETYAASDEQSLKGTSPGRSSLEALDEVRRERTDKVNALRMRDLGGKKDEQSATNSEKSFQHQTSEVRTPTESISHGEKPKRDRKHRASAAPFIPLPSDPPPVAYDTPKNPGRRGSTSSLPGSTSTINGYGGGLSRSVSVTSGSIAGSSIHHSRARQAVREPPKGIRHRRPNSPSLPSSDDEGPKPRTRYSQARLDSVMSEHHVQRARRTDALKEPNHNGLQPRQFDHHEPISPHTPRSPPRSQPGIQPRHSYVSHSQSVHYLEARVAMLERQNKMLQAALLAALDIGVSHDAESVRSGSTSPALESTRIPTINERSMASTTAFETPKTRKHTAHPRHQSSSHHSWASPHRHTSQESHGSFETSSSHSDVSMRAVENMLSDVEVGASGES
ncbi:uncharacterized protein TRUGW13939_04127 [Talaromyces rugulosus]|uniref:Uncharacterized protein n=1 Tax=Talaromyces rugulosus TaxID=121627 RepID=A0A7H8QSX1_TALRU|nr:uncharacterized protein TRUGW13939_04127 [Talaromyces rugulosus]QKX57019.1 hypothetical protein TRUGW13939_04127 [Talaromyces rugulosus]